MRRTGFLAAALALALILSPGLAQARAGSGGSFGSRGSMTYSMPPSTSTSPFSAAPMQRSLTPQSPGYGSGYGYGGRSSFMSGLFGGLIGAGLGGLLFGHGLFYGIRGFGGLFGLLIQICLIVALVRFVARRMFGVPAFAGAPIYGGSAGMGMPSRPMASGPPVAIGPADYQAFEQLLQRVQAAWSGHDLNTLRALATPEMVAYLAEQMSDQASRGVRNTVTDVHLDQGDLAEAWAEQGREYATVAMRFSMIDVTRDAAGRVVEGDPMRRTQATEIWTFLRAPGGHWVLSAIQQAR